MLYHTKVLHLIFSAHHRLSPFALPPYHYPSCYPITSLTIVLWRKVVEPLPKATENGLAAVKWNKSDQITLFNFF